jgi:hypothetical protein
MMNRNRSKLAQRALFGFWLLCFALVTPGSATAQGLTVDHRALQLKVGQNVGGATIAHLVVTDAPNMTTVSANADTDVSLDLDATNLASSLNSLSLTETSVCGLCDSSACGTFTSGAGPGTMTCETDSVTCGCRSLHFLNFPIPTGSAGNLVASLTPASGAAPDPNSANDSIALTIEDGPAVNLFGLTHAIEGQATVGTDDFGNLVVTNIGSSGIDGVDIELGQASEWTGQLSADVSTTGATLRLTTQGVRLGVGSASSDFELERTSGATSGIEIGVTFGSDTYDVEVLLAGVVVHQESGFPSNLLSKPVEVVDIECVDFPQEGTVICCNASTCIEFVPKFKQQANDCEWDLTLAGGPIGLSIASPLGGQTSVSGDRIRFIQNASTVGQVVTQTMQLRGTDVPSTYFVSETVTPASFSVPALDTRKQALLGIALLGIGLTLLKLSRRRRVRRA